MVGVGKLCYIVIIDEEEAEGNGVELASCSLKKSSSFLYTRPVLQSMLQLVGCKVNHSFKIARRVFDILESENLQPAAKFGERGRSYSNTNALSNSNTSDKNFKDIKMTTMLLFENLGKDLLMNNKEKLFDLYKKETAIIVKRERFLDVICHSLAEYHYVGLSQRADIALACRVHERKDSVTILLCGTSGCGKSTLSSLLASRLGITTVVSTDSIRHMMRGFVDEKDNPLLWASTYHAGEFLDPISIAKAKAKKKAMKVCTSPSNEQFVYEESATIPGSTGVKFCHKNETVADDPVEIVGSKVLAIAGYKAQSEMVIDSLDRLITIWEDRKESVVVEGVHLSLNFVMGLMKKHPSIMPFLIYIANEEKHLERFAVRAKYMTLDPQKNKYVKYIRNIRTIQDYLCKRADKHLVPQVNNTNIDRSVASIHSTIFSCLRKRQMGELLYDIATNTVKVINEEYSKQCSANSISSKGMFRVFQRQGSSGRYMAIINSDGSIAKAWPFSYLNDIEELRSSNGGKSSVGSPIYGPLRIGKTEPVNIQFGNFGISSWPNDLEGTSYTSSMNTSRVDGDEDTACYSSCSSSALHSEGHEKELIEDEAVPESDEELPDEEVGSSDSAEELEEDELGGSVVESSTRSDEEYETDQLNERSSADLIGHFTYLYDDCSVKCKPSKSCSRTLSMRPNRKPIRERRLYSRCRSLPIEEHQANTQIDANTPKSSSDVYMDGSNRCGHETGIDGKPMPTSKDLREHIIDRKLPSHQLAMPPFAAAGLLCNKHPRAMANDHPPLRTLPATIRTTEIY